MKLFEMLYRTINIYYNYVSKIKYVSCSINNQMYICYGTLCSFLWLSNKSKSSYKAMYKRLWDFVLLFGTYLL